MEGYIDRIMQIPILRNFDPIELQSLIESGAHRFRKKKKGEHLAYEGDKLEEVILLLKGTVYTEMNYWTNKKFAVELFHAPCVLAPGFIYAKDSMLYVNVITKTDCDILFISQQTFSSLLRSNTSAMSDFVQLLSDRISRLCGRIHSLAMLSLKERTLNYLEEHPIQSVEFASIELGVDRTSLSRILSALKREKLVVRTMDGIELVKKTHD